MAVCHVVSIGSDKQMWSKIVTSWNKEICQLIISLCHRWAPRVEWFWDEPYARLDIFCCCNQTSFSSIFLRDLHLPRVLRPDSLMGTVKGEGKRGRCLRVKVAVGFKYSWSSFRLVIIASSDCRARDSLVLVLKKRRYRTWCSERAGRWKPWRAAGRATFQGSRQAVTQVAR